MFSSESSDMLPDADLQFLADGVVTLGKSGSEVYLEVEKYRGSGLRRGRHQVRNGPTGLRVFPRPVPPLKRESNGARHVFTSGVATLDRMLGGGLEEGTVTLVTGPSGTGKSTLAAMFAAEAAQAGRKAAVYAFEEETGNLLRRCDALGVPLRTGAESDAVLLRQVEPMRYLSDEFALAVQHRVRNDGIELVVLDSLAGYDLTVRKDEAGGASIHALAKVLTRMGVTVLLVNEIEAVTGQFRVSERAISYLADNVILLRYFETDGALEKVLGVLKKRLSPFDPRLRPFEIGPDRFRIRDGDGDAHGMLTGQNLAAGSD